MPIRYIGIAGFIALVSLNLACTGLTSRRPYAETPEDLARELVRLNLRYGMYEALTEQAANSMLVSCKEDFEQELDRELYETEYEELQEVMKRTLMDVFTPQAWEEAIIPVYMKHFTGDELRDLLRFYETPVGSKLLETQAPLRNDYRQVAKRMAEEREGELMIQLLKEFKKTYLK
jgi:hypothetical protein